MSNNLYNNDFYKDRADNTEYSARILSTFVVKNIGNIKSVVDVGCGVGAWLREFKNQKIEVVKGYDGHYVNKNFLVIDKEEFEEINLEKVGKETVSRRFDLCVSLEVAEHISKAQAVNFIEFLTSLSPTVLFSAAIPGQGGVNHINEQWPKYWINIFKDKGYTCLDVIRPEIWENDKVILCYRNNAMIFTRDKHLINQCASLPTFHGNNLVHPTLFNNKLNRGVKESYTKLLKSIYTRLKK
jgi:cyclopropane fatty-acyl-phospholipid synthase-like methyltransferase